MWPDNKNVHYSPVEFRGVNAKTAVQKAQAQTNVKLHGETRCRLEHCDGDVADDAGRLGRDALSLRGWLPTFRCSYMFKGQAVQE